MPFTKQHFGKFRQRERATERKPIADVIVIGGGLAGLTSALACARRGLAVTMVSGTRSGAASLASAGVLGPSIGRGPKGGRVGRFMFAARDRYPRYLDELHELAGIRVPSTTGALELAFNETHLAELRARAASLPETRVLGADEVARAEPAIVSVAGALHHPRDGAVDVAVLLDALAAAIRATARITVVNADVQALANASSLLPNAMITGSTTLAAPAVVIAAGAWTAGIAGLPRALPIVPIKGEVALLSGTSAVRQVTFGAGGYLVPRGDELLVGATSEDVGFDAIPSATGAAALETVAGAVLRGLRGAQPFTSQRAGLRPMTPDGYPILGRDPDAPALIYACGYSRNGVLVSPLAADCVAALAAGEDAPFDLSAFSVARFGSENRG
ncbi:MAG: NAD(P)/FAD-dependent oxidoreductase [Gemmatimonadaceae bacterium]